MYIFKKYILEVGARNERRLCAVNCNKTAGFEIVHGLLDRVMLLLEVAWNPKKTNEGYYLQPIEGKLLLCCNHSCTTIIHYLQIQHIFLIGVPRLFATEKLLGKLEFYIQMC